MEAKSGIGYLRATYNPNLHFTENSEMYANLLYPYIQDNAGNEKITSLSIDVININENTKNKNRFKQQEWAENQNNKGNILLDQMIWGFKEATNENIKSKALSNAFCFNQQKLTIKINKKGHLEGYLGNEYLYEKNNIEISVVDLYTGEQNTLLNFNDFNSSLENSQRVIQWEVPEKNNNLYTEYGLFGLYTFRIKVNSELFIDSKRNQISKYNNRISNSYMQLLTFSPSNEAKNVNPDNIQIFNETINGNENFIELFEKSIFEQLKEYNQNELSEDQKRAIIADQIAVLFMSQHPVILSDLTPSKIQGIGGEKATEIKKVINEPINYSQKYNPDIIKLAENRLFGMLANYKNFSFANEIDEEFSTKDQSNQYLREPSRIIYIDKNGKLNDEIGEDGVLFAPYVIENQHTEILKELPKQRQYQINLFKYSVGIDNININNENNEIIECGDDKIKLSFNIIFGQENIKEIYYQITVFKEKILKKYIDKLGNTNSHIFDISDHGEISCDENEGNIIIAKVTIIDKYGFENIFERKLFLPNDNIKPSITEITSFQRQDGSKLIDILYYYEGTSEVNQANVVLEYSKDNITFENINNNVIGDIGNGINPGYRKITWNPESILEENDDIIFLKILLTDIDGVENQGMIESSIAVININQPTVDIRRISDKEQQEMEETSSQSESSNSSFSSESSSSSSSS